MSFEKLIQRGAQRNRPLKWLIYSEPKLGKTHLCAGAPGVFFLDCERGSLEFDVGRAPITSWDELDDGLNWLERAQHDFRTIVLDTLDEIERLACSFVAHRDGVPSVAEVGGGFGKGWQEVEEIWHDMTRRLDRIQVRRGINVILLAHSDLERFKDPDSGVEFDRFTMRASKKTLGVFKGWVDEILFMKRRVTTRNKHSRVGQDGGRVVLTDSAPGRVAGSRRGLPSEIVIPKGPPARAWSALAEAARKAAGNPKGASGRQQQQPEASQQGTAAGEPIGDGGSPPAGPPPAEQAEPDRERPEPDQAVPGEGDPPSNDPAPPSTTEPDPDFVAGLERAYRVLAKQKGLPEADVDANLARCAGKPKVIQQATDTLLSGEVPAGSKS